MAFTREHGLTLGTLITRLEALPGDRMLRPGINYTYSYRGYYDCLGLQLCEENTVYDVLLHLRRSNGATMEGYKGGTYLMTLDTECFLAEEGYTGIPLTEEWFQLHWGSAADLQRRVAELEAQKAALEAELETLRNAAAKAAGKLVQANKTIQRIKDRKK